MSIGFPLLQILFPGYPFAKHLNVANTPLLPFRYEYRDAFDSLRWKRCYGIEHWTFAPDGRMEKRQMSGNDIEISEEKRWFKEGVDVDQVDLSAKDF